MLACSLCKRLGSSLRFSALRAGFEGSTTQVSYAPLRIEQKRLYAKEGKRGKRKYVEAASVKQTRTSKRPVDVFPDMNAEEIAKTLEVSVDEIIEAASTFDKSNFNLALEGKALSSDSVLKVVSMFDCKPRFVNRKISKNNEQDDDIFPQLPAADSDCTRRPPVVTIMGHVDHGKTTLLDALRNSKITHSEYGGITQHIGAFSVQLPNSDRRVTFLDTPGHAAFAAMRARGARGADIVVLVVAADDGVKEQTIQSIKFAQSAGVPLVVAVNKCDKPTADPMRAKRSLLEHGIVVEDLGGDVQCVEISALHGKNLPALQDALIVQADLMNLRATAKGHSEGVVIESSVSHGIGKLCTVVVTRGTLKKNAILVAGTSWCRVRTMTDDQGNQLAEASPGTPVRVSGWRDELPAPGDLVLEASTVDKAQRAVLLRNKKEMQEKAERDWDATEQKRSADREKYLENRQRLLDKGIRFGSTLRRIVHRENRLTKDTDDGHPRLKIIIRTDVEGTLEAIMEVIETYNSEMCKLQIVDFGVGPPNEKDIEIAAETGAQVYMFNVTPGTALKSVAERSGVRLEHFNVIYRLVEALKSELSSRLPTLTELELVGEGHVLKEFLISDRARKRQPIAGCLVDWGNFGKNCIFKFIRKGKVFYEGSIESMKCDMEVVATVKTNMEVGIALDDKNIRFKEDDTVEVYEKKDVRQQIDWHPPGF